MLRMAGGTWGALLASSRNCTDPLVDAMALLSLKVAVVRACFLAFGLW